MSPLVARPGRNAARQAKKLKEVRKVKAAIQWHERERKKRQEMQQQRWDAKQAIIQRVAWENEHVKGVRKLALANTREDWRLGPLRPNRAFGEGAAKYGALTAEQVQKPEIPTRTQENRNAQRTKQGLPLEYPLVVDDTKYFPIVKDDRVVVLTGKDKGRIGVVSQVYERTHEVMVKDINLQYYDSAIFSDTANPNMGPIHPSETPIPIDDVRLVVPYEWTREGARRYSDVVVEKIFMERHTTGIDPFTGTDYGSAKIPEKHQYDPETGLPIFHRYIAGTQHRIEWPWEMEEEAVDMTSTDTTADKRNWFRKSLNTVRHPVTSLKSWRSQQKRKDSASELADRAAKKAELEEIEVAKKIPRSHNTLKAVPYDGVDSTRNIVEGAESMSYTLLAPPFPDSLSEELRDDIHAFSLETKKDPDTPRSPRIKRMTEAGAAASNIAKEMKRASDKMKTPMQLRWELEHAKKVSAQKQSPLVETEALMLALGQHMQKNGAKAKKSRKVEDLD